MFELTSKKNFSHLLTTQAVLRNRGEDEKGLFCPKGKSFQRTSEKTEARRIGVLNDKMSFSFIYKLGAK